MNHPPGSSPASRRTGRLLAAGALVHGLLLACVAVTLVPFFWLVTSALKNKTDFFASVFLPRGPGLFGVAWDRLTLENFHRLFAELPMLRAIINSFFLSASLSLVATLFCAMGGYALAKYPFRGRRTLTACVLAAAIIPPSLLLAPGFELIWHLGLLDTYAGFLLPGLAPAFGVFLFRQAMLNSVPAELIESARLDGCGEVRIFFELVLPLVRPMVGAFIILSFLGTWNNFIGPQLILQSVDHHPLAVAINNLRGVYGTDYGLVLSGTLVSIAPIMALFLLLQREFITGLTAGAVKA
ncbi:MAG: carbohydrate ABC transporter permease [Verrucomicrobia bacterium]|nr:carbohydrate ABC transporter permease [Verrucomicrobiota bacterium]